MKTELIIEGECTELPEVKRFYMPGIILKSKSCLRAPQCEGPRR